MNECGLNLYKLIFFSICKMCIGMFPYNITIDDAVYCDKLNFAANFFSYGFLGLAALWVLLSLFYFFKWLVTVDQKNGEESRHLSKSFAIGALVFYVLAPIGFFASICFFMLVAVLVILSFAGVIDWQKWNDIEQI